ncbi:MAG TPA: anti-anti-sigma factor, partial [Pseudomonadota bacterium]|nr:anti-anti-sigma factor [Pseudomonadota bacterium]
MGTRTIVSGMTPAIVKTLTEMGFSAGGFETALDLESALTALSTIEEDED